MLKLIRNYINPNGFAVQPGGIGSLESILGLLKGLKTRTQATKIGEIDSLESIPGLLGSFKNVGSVKFSGTLSTK
jgi:hypothetical protein